jgi:hypothetical protein
MPDAEEVTKRCPERAGGLHLLVAAGTSNPLLSIDRLQPRDATPLLQHFKC